MMNLLLFSIALRWIPMTAWPYELMTGNIETGEVTKRKDFYTTRLECYYPQIYDFDADTLAYCYTDRD